MLSPSTNLRLQELLTFAVFDGRQKVLNHVVLPVINLAVALSLRLLVLSHVHIHLRVALEVAETHIREAFCKKDVSRFVFAATRDHILAHRRILSIVVFL